MKFTSFDVQFTDTDREILAGYFRLAESVAELIGPHSEVVIHSLESFDKSVVKIVNGHHTGRNPGSPITDLGLKVLRTFESTGETTPKSYFTTSKDGSLLKSTTCVVAGEGGKPIGLFCININLSHPFPDIIKTLMPDSTQLGAAVSENFSASAHDLITHATEQAIEEVDNDPAIGPKNRKKEITRRLFDGDIFEFKEATIVVSERLGITRHAVYKYIREFKS
ncbi:PAS domain-containing protein [uncultured Endozoicomonas sp.]|uniref:helix-turn-helix transcriptional regulator n=1 Tax=uncultured Endozoicomonas sp. TaxID=432652 RepID=UPI002631F7E8|nr:PAS domain-containing protein [uncultured Endozoicomonas sp.]